MATILDRDNHVYIFAKKDAGRLTSPIKVGISNNLAYRLEQIGTASPFPVGLYHAYNMVDRSSALAVERGFHRELREFRVHRELFGIEPMAAHYTLCHYIRRFYWCQDAESLGDVFFNYEKSVGLHSCPL